jgi:hypothetical protein
VAGPLAESSSTFALACASLGVSDKNCGVSFGASSEGGSKRLGPVKLTSLFLRQQIDFKRVIHVLDTHVNCFIVFSKEVIKSHPFS